MQWRVIVVGGHTRSIGKTQLVCDLIGAFPEANWIAGKITQYGHNFCVKKGKFCDCAPTEHVCALTWENGAAPRTDSGRFLTAGAQRSFWLRTKQGYLAEGIPLLRAALQQIERSNSVEPANLILESNTLLEFLKPSLYLMVLDSTKRDFKASARKQMEHASGFVLRQPLLKENGSGEGASTSTWADISSNVTAGKPQFLQREGEQLPLQLRERVSVMFADNEGVAV
jgi:hypothetical protein